jgi:hypothetical protein
LLSFDSVFQEGALSSKSAIGFSSEFKGVDNHFLSTGPVISTRLSCKSCGMLPAVHLLSLIATVSIGNAGNLPLSKPFVELRDFRAIVFLY